MMAPTTCPESAALKALISSVLPPTEEERLTVHLESCGRCREALQLLAASSTSWANLPRRLIEVLPTDPVLRESLARITA
jgi:anti-sigma factor RsiW